MRGMATREPRRHLGERPSRGTAGLSAPTRLERPRLLAGLLLGAALLALLTLSTAAPAFDARVANGRLLAVALADAGQDVGLQCKGWVNRLFSAQARRAGSAARLGGEYGDEDYLRDARGARISAAQAGPGDVIQVADFARPEGGAPLHTAIVVSPLGAGRFLVVDANYVAEETVAVHVWDPAEYAGDRAEVRFYRLGRPCHSDPRVPQGELLSPGPGERLVAGRPLELMAAFTDDTAVRRVRYLLLAGDRVIDAGADIHRGRAGIWSVTTRVPAAGQTLRVLALAQDERGSVNVVTSAEYLLTAPF
jgi:hypothetical protein